MSRTDSTLLLLLPLLFAASQSHASDPANVARPRVDVDAHAAAAAEDDGADTRGGGDGCCSRTPEPSLDVFDDTKPKPAFVIINASKSSSQK